MTSLSIHTVTGTIQPSQHALFNPLALASTGSTADKTSTSPSVDILDQAILAGNARAQAMNSQMLASVVELAFNMGQTYQLLQDEEVRLPSEIALQKRRIELLETEHQEKWAAHVEATKVRMCTISSEISKIVVSIETFQAQYPHATYEARMNLLTSLGTAVFSKTMGALAIHATYLSFFKEWLTFTDRPVHKSLERHPNYKNAIQSIQNTVPGTITSTLSTLSISTQVIEVDTNSEVLIQAKAFPQLAPSVQKICALERSIASKKQELAALKQLQELREKDHRGCIKAWNILVHKGTFDPCLRYANLLKRWMEDYVVKANAGILAYETENPYMKNLPLRPTKYAGIEEANRLKGMICAIIPEIEKAIEWTKGDAF